MSFLKQFLNNGKVITESEDIEFDDFEDNEPWTKQELLDFINDLEDDDVQFIGDAIYGLIMHNDETDEFDDFDFDDYEITEADSADKPNLTSMKKCGDRNEAGDPRDDGEVKGSCDKQAGKDKADVDVVEKVFFQTKKKELNRAKHQDVAARRRKAKLLSKYYKRNKSKIARKAKLYKKKVKRNPNKIRHHRD